MASITYTIPDAKFAEFKEAFLKKCRIPVGPTGDSLMTENEWIKEWGKRQFIHAYKTGREALAIEQTVIDEGILT